jgi:hypothetical protein
MAMKNQNKKRKKKPDLNETAFNIVKKSTQDNSDPKKKPESDNNHN